MEKNGKGKEYNNYVIQNMMEKNLSNIILKWRNKWKKKRIL